MRRVAVTLAALVLGIAGTGCANLHSTAEPDHALSATSACAAWFVALDDQARIHGVRDGGEHRLSGFEHLRVNRLLASFRHELRSAEQRRDWYGAMRQLDERARALEAERLPPMAWLHLGVADLDAWKVRTRTCRDTLEATDLQQPRRWQQLVDAAQVPDDYHTAWRVAGAYVALRVPFYMGVQRWQRGLLQRFEAASKGTAHDARVVRWGTSAPRLDQAAVAATMAAIPRNALGLPQPSSAQAQSLLNTFAPDFAVRVLADHDRPGALVWRKRKDSTVGDGSMRPQVDPARPTVYQRVTSTRWDGQVLLQLVYTLWFPQRPPERALDLLAGELDGVVWRVTLGPDGRVWMHDTIHPCGCYHLFFPVGSVSTKPAPEPRMEWAFVPRTLKPHGADQRVTVHVSSLVHDVVRVDVAPHAQTPERYDLVDDHQLRALPTPEGARHSIYRDDGLVEGSERGERYMFWPMGIASAGAMRQWGRQPTAFVGRRHFDDAHLLDLRFRAPRE